MEKSENDILNARLETFKAQVLNNKKPLMQKLAGIPTQRKYFLKRDIYLSWEYMDSEAFRRLSGKAKIVVLRFLQKRSWKGKGKKTTYCNTNLAFTYEEAEELGIKRSRFCDIIKELVEFGFIDIEHQGNGLSKDYSIYAVSDRWKYYGTPNFKHVTKQKVCRAGHDVHSRKLALKQVTENRNYQLRESVSIGNSDSQHVSGNS